MLQYQRADHREMLKVGCMLSRESRARLHDAMSRVSKWTMADAMKWDDAAEEEVLQSHFNDENACAEGTFVSHIDSLQEHLNQLYSQHHPLWIIYRRQEQSRSSDNV